MHLNEYKKNERSQSSFNSAVDGTGSLLEYETLELRVTPTSIVVDTKSHPDFTIVKIDSANRPGTLIEVRNRYHGRIIP